jgi:RpiR family glv operon transcriptional regulator
MRLEVLIDENYEKLNENDLYIWNYILHHKKECQTMSIQDLASKCNVSHTTILRFTHKLGLQGYSEMKIHLKWEDKQQSQFDSREIEKTYDDIEKTMEVMKKRDFYDVFELLDSADRIYVYGSGAVQKNAAKDLKRSMIFGNKLVYVLEGREETNIILDALSSKDVFFLLSLSGNNLFMNDFARKLKEKGMKIISITQVGNNELASLSDVSLQFYTHPISISKNQMGLYSTAQFFLINQILLLKYLEYR